jgi:hypothetical protein
MHFRYFYMTSISPISYSSQDSSPDHLIREIGLPRHRRLVFPTLPGEIDRHIQKNEAKTKGPSTRTFSVRHDFLSDTKNDRLHVCLPKFAACRNFNLLTMGLHHWQCRASGDNDILCTQRKQSGKDSEIEAQPLLLFM